MSSGNYPIAPLDLADPDLHRRAIAQVVNNLMNGKMNATGQVTLQANAATTTINDRRLGANTVILLMPQTANAAAALSSTYVSSQGKFTATFTHANNAQTDRTYRYAAIG